jgi:hypothetical protein
LLACSSPRLFAACHVLHRRPVPRHPPCALIRLTSSPFGTKRTPKGTPRTNSPTSPPNNSIPDTTQACQKNPTVDKDQPRPGKPKASLQSFTSPLDPKHTPYGNDADPHIKARNPVSAVERTKIPRCSAAPPLKTARVHADFKKLVGHGHSKVVLAEQRKVVARRGQVNARKPPWKCDSRHGPKAGQERARSGSGEGQATCKRSINSATCSA